jgi:hypothetical protein
MTLRRKCRVTILHVGFLNFTFRFIIPSPIIRHCTILAIKVSRNKQKVQLTIIINKHIFIKDVTVEPMQLFFYSSHPVMLYNMIK